MKRIIMMTMLLALLITKPVQAEEIFLYKAIATAYCITGETATGSITTENRTAASKPEWFGATLYIWFDDGDGIIKPENFIGTYTVEDTGGESVKSGRVIDIYIANYEEAKKFGNKKVLVQVIKSEG